MTCAFTPAWAATFVAAKRPVFHTGKRQHVSYGRYARASAVKDIFNIILQQSVFESFCIAKGNVILQ